MSKFRIGIDLGGTKIEILAIDASGNELFRKRVATPRGEYEGTIQAIGGLVAAAEQALGVSSQAEIKIPIGIGIPGAVSPSTGLVKNANSVWIIGKPFDRDLEKALHRNVRLANDANCFALSEATDGAGKGAPIVFGVILGTGTGGGIVVNGQVLTGANAISGEWGHNPLPWPSAEESQDRGCYCGSKICIETFLSGPALEKEFEREAGKKLSASDIAKQAVSDPTAERVLARYEERLARALSHIINFLDPHVIVLGGGLSNLDRLYTNVPNLWDKYIFSDVAATRLVKNKHGDSSGVRGAAWLWPA